MQTIHIGITFFLLLAAGCASTTVRKNPGPHDHGIRYNLPKPYLFLQPATSVDASGKVKEYIPNMVDITIEMRPDYSEEYSVHVRAGIGINKTALTLKDGWQLTQINFSVDSNTSENINAVADLIGNIPKFGKSGGGEDGPVNLASNVPAFNVPLGYYESIISEDSCGRKQLFGWRYIGFLPFNACPTVACGTQEVDCRAGEVFGLVYENGIMSFKRLDEIAATDVKSVAQSNLKK